MSSTPNSDAMQDHVSISPIPGQCDCDDACHVGMARCLHCFCARCQPPRETEGGGAGKQPTDAANEVRDTHTIPSIVHDAGCGWPYLVALRDGSARCLGCTFTLTAVAA